MLERSMKVTYKDRLVNPYERVNKADGKICAGQHDVTAEL
jgi:hypothetical protein